MRFDREYLLIARHALGYSVLRVALLLVLMILDPFGAVSASGERSRGVWEQIYAQQYFQDRLDEAAIADTADPLNRPRDPPGRDASTVLLMNEAGWKELVGNRPASALDIYDLIEQVIRPSADEGGRPPKAIFVDLAVGWAAPKDMSLDTILDWTDDDVAKCELRDDKEKLSPFRCMIVLIGEKTRYRSWQQDRSCFSNSISKLACIHRAGGIPILFGDPRDRKLSYPADVDAGYRALDSVATLTPVDYASSDAYFLVDYLDAEAGNVVDYRLYPPAALFAIYCGLGTAQRERTGTSHSPRPCRFEPPFAAPTTDPDAPTWRKSFWSWSDEYRRSGALVWGLGGESRFTEEMVGLTNTPFAGHCRAAGGTRTALLEILRQAGRGLTIDRAAGCPYPKLISYAELGRLTPTQVDMALDDRLVIIGDDQDFVENKLLGQVNGPIWHAMALDNLISFGPDYPKAPRQILGLTLTDHDLTNLLAAFLMLLPGACVVIWGRLRNQRLGERSRLSRHEWAERAVALGIALAVFLAIIFIMTFDKQGWAAHFNYVALSIVCLVELFAVLAVLLDPVRKSMLSRYRWMRFFYNELPAADPDPDTPS